MKKFDFIIVGAGIVGLTVAREILNRRLGSVCILEKEPELGLHSSGRNSGVLHSGIYYPEKSLKARVCSAGAIALKSYAQEHKIPVLRTGKIILAVCEKDLNGLDVLQQRARANNIDVHRVKGKDLTKIEPCINDQYEGLYLPSVTVIDPKAVLNALELEIGSSGCAVMKGSKVCDINMTTRTIATENQTIFYGHLVNAAGLYADKIAQKMGIGLDYTILPFKGLYKKLSPEASKMFNGSIYPVPDLDLPFLGVHLTRTVHGEVTVGPTAMPALGRENYRSLIGSNAKDLISIMKNLFSMLIYGTNNLPKFALVEIERYLNGLVDATRLLAPTLQKKDLIPSSKIGIRAQLVRKSDLKFIMDFIIESGPMSTHVLNAISPAFTGSFEFSKIVVDRATNAISAQNCKIDEPYQKAVT